MAFEQCCLLELNDKRGGRLGAWANLFHADGELSKIVCGPHGPLARELRPVVVHELLEPLAADVDGFVLALFENACLHIYNCDDVRSVSLIFKIGSHYAS
jgi:hypothetical protein